MRVPNDLFADRLILTGTSSIRIGTTAGATVEPGEPTPTTQTPARHSVWYAWTAPNDGGAVLKVIGHGFEPVVAVYAFAPGETELTVNRLEQLANASGNPIAELSFFITAGKTYYLAVDGRAGGSGSFDLTLASSELPSVNIVSPTTGTAFVAPATVGVTANAIDLDGTISRVEVLFNGLSGGVSTSKPYGVTTNLTIQQAYTLTAVATDNLGFSSTSAPVVIVVRGPGNLSPTVSWQQPAAGTEFGPGEPIPMHAVATDPDGLVARVEFYSGSTWLATISEAPYQSVWRGAAQGPHTLRAVAIDLEGARTTNNLPLSVVVPVPENDAFADRAVLSGARTTGLGNNLGATWEPGEPAHAGLLPARSLWWTWTAPGAGRLSLNTVGSGFDTVLAVYAGSNLAELAALAANNDDGTNLSSRLGLPVTGGQTIGIAVDSASDSGGAVVFEPRVRSGTGGDAHLPLSRGRVRRPGRCAAGGPGFRRRGPDHAHRLPSGRAAVAFGEPSPLRSDTVRAAQWDLPDPSGRGGWRRFECDLGTRHGDGERGKPEPGGLSSGQLNLQRRRERRSPRRPHRQERPQPRRVRQLCHGGRDRAGVVWRRRGLPGDHRPARFRGGRSFSSWSASLSWTTWPMRAIRLSRWCWPTRLTAAS